MKKILNISILVLFISANSFGQTVNKNITEIIEKYANDTLLNGSIIVAQKNNIIYQGSFGYANFETKSENTNTTLFPIASLTKQFTSSAILILQERGKLNIDDNISNYLKVPKSMQNVTIKNLMNHTSGIPDYWTNGIENNKDSIFKFHFKHDTLLFSSNTDHRYCNSGYFLLGQIIKNISGKTYDDFLKENIFDPIGMNNTFVYDRKEYKRAIGYDEKWNINDFLIKTGDGGIISTVDDLLLWDIALSENKILSKKSMNSMIEPLKLENGKIINYGFGWDINANNKNIISHTGWLASFGAYNQYDVENEYFFILLSNRILPELMDLIIEVNKELYK
ncbi:MAG: beta-lactamase family protein [Bacteroidales bacterium]|nr:beta-lactamase family protein [Bacteroidales bacterium]